MGSFSGLGIGLSFVFGCILMGLVAELYYLLWWKKKIANSTTEIEGFSLLFCWRKPTSFNSSQTDLTVRRNPQQEEDLEVGPHKVKDVICEEEEEEEEEGVEQELMRIHNLCGPPRFLFTIKEESKEDLESDDGKSRKCSRTRSLSDLVFLTPMSSPTLNSLDSYNHHGINPLFESISEAEINRLRSSPPPKFKFLKDAEDKLLRKLLKEEADKRMGSKVEDSVQESVLKDCQNSRMESKGERSCGFVSVINVREQIHNQASQVLPLASSPLSS